MVVFQIPMDCLFYGWVFQRSLWWPMEKTIATHSSSLAGRIPRTDEPGRLWSMGSLRVGHDWASSLSLFTFMHWKRTGNPLQYSCLENPRDGGAWWVAVYGIAQSRTWLKQLSSSSSSSMITNECMSREFSGDPVIRTQYFHWCGPRLITG